MRQTRLQLGLALAVGAGLTLGLVAGLTVTGLTVTGLTVTTAHAQPAKGDADDRVWSSCPESIPKGVTPPTVVSTLPDRGLSGYAVYLSVEVTHGSGETVMPEGFRIRRSSDAVLALRDAGWELPEPEGGAAPVVERPEEGAEGTVKTLVKIPFVPLPPEPGRHVMLLPPMPITVARASGELMTLCTQPQQITIDDPIANEPDPEVRPNPPPRPQREEWELLRNLTYGGLAALITAALMTWFILSLRKRPKPPPPKPRVLPWVAALKELDAIRRSSLLEEDLDAYFDRVDHCTRLYLGERYGFDGLEATSGELKQYLGRVHPPITDPKRIHAFLEDGDFLKYAEVTPTREDCETAMQRADAIVRATMPPGASPDGPSGGSRGKQRKKAKKKRKRKAEEAA